MEAENGTLHQSTGPTQKFSLALVTSRLPRILGSQLSSTSHAIQVSVFRGIVWYCGLGIISSVEKLSL